VAQTHFEGQSLEPRDDLAQNYLANAYLQKRLDKAQAFRGRPLNPKNQSNYNLGLISLMQQRPDEASSSLKKFIASPRMCLDRILRPASSHPETEANSLRGSSMLKPQDPRIFQVATMLALHQDYLSAIPLLEQARQAFPNSYDVSFNLALAYFRSEQFGKAKEVLAPLVDQGQKAEAYNLFGSILEKLGDEARARESLRKAMEQDPGNEDFHFDYANHLLQFENSQSAIDAFASEAKRFPKSWRMRLGLGSACYLSGKNEEAAQALLQAVQLKPNSKLAYFLLGKIYESADSAQTSIYEALKAYCDRKPDDPWAYYHYGTILYLRAQSGSSSDFQMARLMLEKAIQQNPNLAEAHLQLGLSPSERTMRAWRSAPGTGNRLDPR
jgi:tetratricopeptide (TPR) repeat protein